MTVPLWVIQAGEDKGTQGAGDRNLWLWQALFRCFASVRSSNVTDQLSGQQSLKFKIGSSQLSALKTRMLGQINIFFWNNIFGSFCCGATPLP